jgi:cell division protein FtsB
MKDEELDIFWRLKRLEEKKRELQGQFQEKGGSIPYSRPKTARREESTYSIPEIRSNTFYENYKAKRERVLGRYQPVQEPAPVVTRPIPEETKKALEMEKQRATNVDNKIKRNFNLKPDINWFKVSVVLSLLLSIVLVTSFSLYSANRQIDSNLNSKDQYVFDLEKQLQSLIKENSTLKELNDSLNKRNDLLRQQLVDARNSMYKLQSTYQNELINEDYAMYLALEFVNNQASLNLPVECGTTNPEVVRVFYEKATIEKQNKTFIINMPADLKYQSVTRYICYIEMDEEGNIVHWNWKKPT